VNAWTLNGWTQNDKMKTLINPFALYFGGGDKEKKKKKKNLKKPKKT
jgi:hypothetical protein